MVEERSNNSPSPERPAKAQYPCEVTWEEYRTEMQHAYAGLTCAVTGSRPANFPWNYYGLTFAPYIELLREKVRNLIDYGVTAFICGMAMGVDMDVAETVLKFRREYDPDIRLVCAVPCPDQQRAYPYSWKLRYKKILENADKVVVVSKSYDRQCYHRRNRYMIDNCDVLFAVWNGLQTGGTAYTIRYAYKSNKKVEILNLTDIQSRD